MYNQSIKSPAAHAGMTRQWRTIAKYLYPFASILISSSFKGSNVQSINQFSGRTRGHDQAVARPRPRRQESSGNVKIETKKQIKTWFSNSSNYFGWDLHTCIQGKFLVLCSLACTAHMVDVKFSLNTFKICTEYFFKIFNEYFIQNFHWKLFQKEKSQPAHRLVASSTFLHPTYRTPGSVEGKKAN